MQRDGNPKNESKSNARDQEQCNGKWRMPLMGSLTDWT